MTPRDFDLFDFLNSAAVAVNEAEQNRLAQAEATWLKACLTASGLFTPVSVANAAVGVLVEASGLGHTGEDGRSSLCNALHAAATAVRAVIDGHPERCDVILPDAFTAVGMLAPFERAAMTVILAEIQRMAEAGVTA